MGGAVESVGDFIQDEVIDPVKEVGRDVDDFVNEEIPGGWYTVGAAAGGAYLYSGAGAAAGAAEAGTAGATAGTAGAGTAAGTGAGLSAGGATVAGMEGALGTGLTAGSTGAGFTAAGAGAPGLASMGGGTGLLTAGAGGGLVGATGLTAAGAVPMLGSSSSFINNPAVLGTDVIGYQAPGFGIRDALDAARAVNSVRNLLGQKPAPIPQMRMPTVQPQGSVQYPSLELLRMQPLQRQSLL